MGRKQTCRLHIAVGHKISEVMSSCSRCVDRLKNSGYWYLNKMSNYSVHLDHLVMLSTSVEIFPAKMFKHASCSSMLDTLQPGRVAQSVGHLTSKSEVLGSIPGLATYFRFSFC